MPRQIWVGKRTWNLFGTIFAAAVILPAGCQMLMVGSQSEGIPFVFYEFSSAPPPLFGSRFYPEWLLADIISYYLLAVLLICFWERRRKHDRQGCPN
jgi:hypothetical protein